MHKKGKQGKAQDGGELSILAGFNPNKAKVAKLPDKKPAISESVEIKKKPNFPFRMDTKTKKDNSKKRSRDVKTDSKDQEEFSGTQEAEVNEQALAELGKRQAPQKSALDSFLQAFGGKSKLRTLEKTFDPLTYSRPVQVSSAIKNVSEVPIVEDIGAEIDAHFDFDCSTLKDHLTISEHIERQDADKEEKNGRKNTQKEKAHEPVLMGSKFLVKAKPTTLKDDDFDDDFDPNQLKSLNNDVVFSSYSYPQHTEGMKKQRFSFNSKVYEYFPRIAGEAESEVLKLQLAEYPNLADNMLEYLEELCKSAPEALDTLRLVNSYRDYYHTDPFCMNAYAFKQVYMLHVVNHINHFFQQSTNKSKAVNGFTKTRALVLAPLKADCVELVEIMMDIVKSYNPEAQFTGLEKFYDEFNTPEETVNSDFRIGIKFTKTGFALFADYNLAELMVCSPEGVSSYEKKKLDLGEKASFSFFSSLEILVLDKVNIFRMSDYEGFEKIFQHLNNIPRHGDTVSDFNTIRASFVENLSKFFRQTIVYSDFMFPELNGLLERQALNFRGSLRNKVEYNCVFEHHKGNPLFKVEFLRIDIVDVALEFEQKFNYFVNQVWMPLLRKGIRERTVIFVASDAEFVKLRNHFKQGNNPGGFINEHTPRAEMQKLVQRFNKHELKFLLVTEKAHFFNICTAKKFLDVIFYSVPANPGIFNYYLDTLRQFLVSGKAAASELQVSGIHRPTVKCLYSKFNAYEIERICGSHSGKDMLSKFNKVSHVEF